MRLWRCPGIRMELTAGQRPGQGPGRTTPSGTGDQMRGFEFQRLRVFEAAANAATEINLLVRGIPLFHRGLRDQLSRSSISVALNIAEGADEYSAREKVRFYRMARRSAAESAGAMELLVRFGVIDRQEIENALNLLNQSAAMLSSMMMRLESKAGFRSASASPYSEPTD